MNTEFPSRVPTITNTQVNPVSTIKETASSSTTKTEQAETKQSRATTKEFQKDVVENFKEVITEVVSIYDVISGMQTSQIRQEKQEEKVEQETKSFRSSIGKALSIANASYKKMISSLDDMAESFTDSVAGAISSTFGGGLFGQVLSKAFSGVMKLAVNKLLIGILLSHPIVILIGTAIAALVASIAIFRKEIMQGFRWLGAVFNQIGNTLAGLFFGTDKYKEAEKGLSKDSGIPKEYITAYYGDTVMGREKMREDWEKAEKDPEFKKALIKSIREVGSYNVNRGLSNTNQLLISSGLQGITESPLYGTEATPVPVEDIGDTQMWGKQSNPSAPYTQVTSVNSVNNSTVNNGTNAPSNVSSFTPSVLWNTPIQLDI